MTPATMGLGIATVILTLDQIAKGWVRSLFTEMPPPLPLTFFLSLAPVWNPGISFGLLRDGGETGQMILTGGTLVIIGVLAVWLWQGQRRITGLALGMVLGGAVGNLVDRLRFGAVFDFLDVRLGAWHFWVFNLADAMITCGAIMLLLDSLLNPAQKSK